MPRKWTEPIQAWPALQPAQGYDVRITEVEKSAEPPGMTTKLEFVKGDQVGRIMTVVLPLPCRSDGLAGLLPACGIDVVVGSRFAPRDLIGRSVRAFFAAQASGDLAVVHFEACLPDAVE